MTAREVLEAWPLMTPLQQQAVAALMSPVVGAPFIRPQPGPQTEFFNCKADIAIVGGSAYGGKSWSLVVEPLRHISNSGFGAVLFRRTFAEITNEGGIWDESFKWFSKLGGEPNTSNLFWKFPSGAKVSFRHCQFAKNIEDYQSAQIALLIFDQLELFEEKMFWGLLARNRSQCGVKPYCRAACNPSPGSWLADLLEWWIDQETGYPILERSGALRYFVRHENIIEWGDSKEELLYKFLDPETMLPLYTPDQITSITFIPSKYTDNKIGTAKDPGYVSRLMSLTRVERMRMLEGNWKITIEDGMFETEKIEIVDVVPRDCARVRYWDKACLLPGTMIETFTGPKPIEQIQIGELVLTRRGFREVESAGPTKTTNELTAVLFSNASVVVGTPDHWVWTENDGWIELASLKHFHYTCCLNPICRDSAWPIIEARTGNMSYSMGSIIHERKASGTSLLSDGARLKRNIAANHCIVPFTSITTAASPLICMFITLTKTIATIRLKISKLLPGASTIESIRILSEAQRYWPILKESVRSLLPDAKPLPSWDAFAWNAERNSSIADRGVCQFIVPRSANGISTTESKEKITPETLSLTNSPRENSLVYDLSVNGENEFFANNILVHNSSTSKKSAYTCGSLVCRDRRYIYIEDLVFGQWNHTDRNRMIKRTAEFDSGDYGYVPIWIETEPGSGGKESSEISIQELMGYDVRGDKVTGAKEERAMPFAAQVSAGNVRIKRAPWNKAFLDALQAAPAGNMKDLWDATAGAFNKLVLVGGGGGGVQIIYTGGDNEGVLARLPKDTFR